MCHYRKCTLEVGKNHILIRPHGFSGMHGIELCFCRTMFLQGWILYSLGIFCTVWDELGFSWFSENLEFCIQDLNRFEWEFQETVWSDWGRELDVQRRPIAVFLFFSEVCFQKLFRSLWNCTTIPNLYKSIPNCTNPKISRKSKWTRLGIVIIPLSSVNLIMSGAVRAAQSIPRCTSFFDGFRTALVAGNWISKDICRV